TRRGVTAAEVDGPAVRGYGPALRIFGGHADAEGLPRADAGRGEEQEIMHGRRADREGVHDIGGRLLDARVRLVGRAVAVQRPAPGHGAAVKDPGPTRRLVDGGVGLVRASLRAGER